jgi:hypothetical protein
MQLQARRVFRLSGTIALTLACAYALQLPLPFIAPLFALLLTAKPGPPMGWKALLRLVLVVLLTLGIGLLLVPLLTYYPVSAILIVGLGLYFSFHLTVNKGQTLVGAFLTIGFTLISVAGTASFAFATTVIQSLVLGIILAILCQWVVYPWFPEEPAPAEAAATRPVPGEQSSWIALRGMLIVLPVYLLALTNPAMYMAIIMKSVSLGQQSSLVTARSAGRELLGSTFLGGCFAILFWMLLGLSPNLWMFFLWMLLLGIYFAGKIYRLIATRYPASFWTNVVMTLLILLGPAVEDSANGKDVYAAFFVRMGLFVAVTLYAWLAVYLLELLRLRRLKLAATESTLC